MSEPLYAQRYRREGGACRRAGGRGLHGPGRAGRPVRRHRRAARSTPTPFLRTHGPRRGGPPSRPRRRWSTSGSDGADCFVVTEDVGGADAAALVARGPLPVADAALVGAAAAAGLAALHEHGVVHGGVDPATLVRDRRRHRQAHRRRSRRRVPAAGPAPGHRAGRRPLPEPGGGDQGRAPSPASDVYRLGLVHYLLLTGRHVFDGADGSTVAQEQLDGVVQPPQFRNPEVPPALAQIVLRALEKDPGARGTRGAVPGGHRARARLGAGAGARRRSRAATAAGSGSLAVLVIVALAALGVAWALGAFDGDGRPRQVAVPDVDRDDRRPRPARRSRRPASRSARSRSEQSDEGPAGTVVAPVPAAGKEVEEGSAVDLEVAGEPSPSRADAGRRARRGRAARRPRPSRRSPTPASRGREPGRERHRAGRRA